MKFYFFLLACLLPYGLGLLGALLLLQFASVLIFTCDLKASHVSDFSGIQTAAKLLPANARVIVAYPYYGASPAVWLHRNVYAVNDPAALAARLPELRADGFDWLLTFDVKSRTKGFWHG